MGVSAKPPRGAGKRRVFLDGRQVRGAVRGRTAPAGILTGPLLRSPASGRWLEAGVSCTASGVVRGGPGCWCGVGGICSIRKVA